jgi:hypothetical protein
MSLAQKYYIGAAICALVALVAALVAGGVYSDDMSDSMKNAGIAFTIIGVVGAGGLAFKGYRTAQQSLVDLIATPDILGF